MEYAGTERRNITGNFACYIGTVRDFRIRVTLSPGWRTPIEHKRYVKYTVNEQTALRSAREASIVDSTHESIKAGAEAAQGF